MAKLTFQLQVMKIKVDPTPGARLDQIFLQGTGGRIKLEVYEPRGHGLTELQIVDVEMRISDPRIIPLKEYLPEN